MNKARLIIASSETCADLYWATRFYVPDPIIYIEHRKKKTLVASDLEVSRAKKEADVDEVLSYSTYERKLRKTGHETLKEGDVLDCLLKEKRIKILQVPSYFPIRQAQILQMKGYKIEPLPDPFYPERAIKTLEEKKQITQTLRTTEAGIQAAIAFLKKAKIKGTRIYSNGSPLTSEELRKVIEIKMMELGAIGQHTIVACGRQAADPHCRGSGPLFANRPIVLDVFPKSTKTGYYGDITRTVLKGRASEALKLMYQTVRKAQENGIKKIRSGIDGSEVHKEVNLTLIANGFKTETLNGKPQGFIHSTGHGLGLDIHEAPRVSHRPGQILRKGNVVTVEPGLYYDHLGGIRIEDVVYVTDKGCEVLTKIPKIFEIA